MLFFVTKMKMLMVKQVRVAKTCYIKIKFECYDLTDGKLNVYVDVNDLKPEEQNMQTGMLATESVRCQVVQQPGVSAKSAASGSVSDPQTEDLQTLKGELFTSIVRKYLQITPPRSSEEHNRFKEYVKEMKLIITGVAEGSLEEELKKRKLKTKIVETEKLKGENKIKRHIKLLWKVVASSNNNLLFEKTLKNYLNTIMWNQFYLKE